MKIKLTVLFLLGLGVLNAQSVKGKITGEYEGLQEPLVGASVYFIGGKQGTIANDKGEFSLALKGESDRLVISSMGYISDTLTINKQDAPGFLNIRLEPDEAMLEEFVITERPKGNYVSALAIDKREIVSFAGLCKMACCNLAESFENSAAVSVGYSDAVSGARQIKMLGMAGVYTQILDENRPVMRGLSSTYGLSYTPGMWLSSIQISKGVSSVINGSEAMAGQINLEHRKPTDEERIFLNLYLDNDLRSEINVSSALPVTPKIQTVILAHGSIDPMKMDRNSDGFTDLPQLKQANIANRWLYSADNGMQIRWGIKALYEDRNAGEMDFDPKTDRGTLNSYGSRIENKLFNAYLKAGIPVGQPVADDNGETAQQSNIAFILDYNFYGQDSYFGIKNYLGEENSVWANLMYNHVLNNKNKFIFGISGNASMRREILNDRWVVPETSGIVMEREHDLSNDNYEAGLFAEYTFEPNEKFDLIIGIRGDYSGLFGFYFTPRGHLRWALGDRSTFRLSGGRGFRRANIITDNIGSLATGRQFAVNSELDELEEAWTYGGSFTQTFKLGNDPDASVSVDFFRSDFSKQAYADQEYIASAVYVYNPDGKSYTNTVQFDFSWQPLAGFDVFATLRYTDAKISIKNPLGGEKTVQKPLVDNFKTLVNLQYATKYNRWVFDATAQLNGQSRLPNNYYLEYSPVYPMFFAQVSHKIRKVDLYLGCENIADYKQPNPIISASSPFDYRFNSSVIWGPIMGRKFYLGLRYNLY